MEKDTWLLLLTYALISLFIFLPYKTATNEVQEPTTSIIEETQGNTFEELEKLEKDIDPKDISNQTIYIDDETGVMYLWATDYKKSALTLMLEKDGSPKLFNEKTNTYTNIIHITNQDVYIDSENGVHYLWISNSYGGDIIAMVQPDGSPKT